MGVGQFLRHNHIEVFTISRASAINCDLCIRNQHTLYTNLHNANTERKNVNNTSKVCVGEMNSNSIQEINQEALRSACCCIASTKTCNEAI